ncbi:MAG: alpha-glucosidase [Oscillospiraceae bacterium]|nr:alpha-glucosidase [Oscillospiraceae bacterium]
MERTWWKESVIYQIYPRSFYDSNGDGNGDLAGATAKLDYLKDLGIDIIWLSPIFKSPNHDNGYDISDYRAIMDEFGTMEDFGRLLSEAHARGIKIMLDLVANHTSDEHPWFIESRKSRDNAYRDYYIWHDGKNGGPPNNWESFFGGPTWEYDDKTGQYYMHLFVKQQPDLNWENPDVRHEIYDMMKWWFDKGVDGFRMDTVNMYSKAPGFPDGEPIPGTPYGDKSPHMHNGPRIHEFLKEMNREVLSKYDIVTVGEAPETSVEDAILYTGFDQGELNMVFTFEHMWTDYQNATQWCDLKFDLVKLKNALSSWQTGLHEKGWNSLYWNNHDQPRVVSRFGDDGEYREVSAKMLAACLHMMQGTPYIYQGEELGMTNVAFSGIDDYDDVATVNAYREYTENRGVSHGDMMRYIHQTSRDNARTPMQWDNTENAGFTTGKPWLKVNPNYPVINAKAQVNDPDSVFGFYKKLIRLRKEHPVIVYGDYELLLPDHPAIFAYLRKLGGETLLTVCSFQKECVEFSVPDILPLEKAKLLLSNYDSPDITRTFTLQPYEARVYLFA